MSMAGVAGPMIRSSRSRAARFLVGLTAGGLAGGVVLAVPVYFVGALVQAAVPMQGRLWLLAGTCALFGIADLTNRTPHVWRQVPQRLIHVLPPGTLGVVWGFDLGLLFTTQKVVSLIWLTIAATVLLDPALAIGVLIGTAMVGSLAIAAWSIGGKIRAQSMVQWRQWQLRARRASGITMLTLFVFTVMQAWQP
jgi:hypothetical protein